MSVPLWLTQRFNEFVEPACVTLIMQEEHSRYSYQKGQPGKHLNKVGKEIVVQISKVLFVN